MDADRTQRVALPTGKPHRLKAYEKVQQAILDGSFEPGTALVEGFIAEWCGISRTPVREALMRLEQDGLVERTDRGLIVRERSQDEILDIYEVRIVLEETAARLAAERHTSMDRVRLEKAAKAAEEADGPDGAVRAQRLHNFHESVWNAGHNAVLVDLLSRLHRYLPRTPETTQTGNDGEREGLRHCRKLVGAIMERDTDSAASIAKHHFTRERDMRLEIWSAQTP